MDTNYYKQYEPIFGSWYIKRKIGEGNFGAVYEIEREDFGTTYHSALKAITIPKSQAELDSIMDDGMDATSAESYLQQFVEKIVGEFVLMSKLKGNSHIVSYEDHQVIKHQNGIGWDILIRMELLTPMMSHMKTTSITKRDVIKLGIDMCRALELCQKYNIIHRDIKPENIFISDSGDFKLGDFGIAKEVEKTQSGLTKTGTQTYMAPEVYKGQPYGSSVDIYSLGVVLYRLLNHNRAPFMPQYPNPISYSDRERALIMRMGGHKFPAPSGVEQGCRIAEIAMKACSFKPDDRYSSPTQMREDLEAILYEEGEGVLMFPSGDSLDIKSVQYVSNSRAANKTQNFADEQTEIMDDDATEIMEDVNRRFSGKKATSPQKKKSKWLVPIVAVLVLAIGLSAFWMTRDTAPETAAVISAQDIKDGIEFKIDDSKIGSQDLNIIEKRLESYAKAYYLDRNAKTVTIAKNDLGSSEQEMLATIHMITGKGEIVLSNYDNTSANTLTNADMKSAVYEHDDKTGESKLIIETTESGKLKLEALSAEIVNGDNKTISLSVDGNTRLSTEITKKLTDGKIVITEKEGQSKNIIASLLDIVSMTVYAEEIKLSSNYMKLIVSFVNDGMLTNSYEIYIDEKYGIVLPETEITPEPEPEITEEPEDVTDEPTQKPTQQKPTQQKPTQQKPTQQQPVQQAPVQQQPVQQQPAEQAPVQQTPAQQPSNNAGMPEVYIDFD